MNKKKLPKAIRPASAVKTAAPPTGEQTIPEPAGRSQRKALRGQKSMSEVSAVSEAKSVRQKSIPASDLILDPRKAMDADPRRGRAIKLVERFALWSGAASLLPIPFADLAAIGGLQLQMVRRISQIYDIPFSENRGKALVSSLAGVMVSASGAIGAASMLKGLPILGTAVSAITMPSLSMASTYVIGMAFIQHFASGGTLLNFEPPDYREFIKAQNDLWNARAGGRPSRKRAEPAGRV